MFFSYPPLYSLHLFYANLYENKLIRKEHQRLLMERGGTGGALFRNLYRDFLKESFDLLHDNNLKKAHVLFCDIALLWTEVATQIRCAEETENQSFLDQASKLLLDISKQEKESMELLLKLSPV